MDKIGFIGSGNITSAILEGMSVNGFDLSNIVLADNNKASLEDAANKFSVIKSNSNTDLVGSCKYIIFAVKSHHYSDVFREIHDVIDPSNHVFISFAPGYSIDEIKFSAKIKEIKVLRARPNTAALV